MATVHKWLTHFYDTKKCSNILVPLGSKGQQSMYFLHYHVMYQTTIMSYLCFLSLFLEFGLECNPISKTFFLPYYYSNGGFGKLCSPQPKHTCLMTTIKKMNLQSCFFHVLKVYFQKCKLKECDIFMFVMSFENLLLSTVDYG